MMPKYAFKAKSKTFGSALGRSIFIMAFPFVTPIAQFIKNILHEQKLRFSSGRLSRNWRAPIDAADLDYSMQRLNAHQRLPSGNLATVFVNDSKKERIIACFCFLKPRLHISTDFWRIFKEPFEPLIGV